MFTTTTSYKPIIIISDNVPNQNYGGISQTLYNIFSNYSGKIYVLNNDLPSDLEGNLSAEYIRINLYTIKPIKNRIGLWLASFIRYTNLSILAYRKCQLPKGVPQTAMVLVSTSLEEKFLFAYELAFQNKMQLIVYCMDDWMWNNQLKWLGGNIQSLVYKSFQLAEKWLLISDNLKQTILNRYSLIIKPTLIVHNPVELQGKTILTKPEHTDKKLVIYAGSIWPMHADALINFAKSINENSNHNILLYIYAPLSQWEQWKHQLRGNNTHYKGFVAYQQMQITLAQADALLVAASFANEFKAFSHSSVQTKLTDYMNAGKPIICIAPPDSAVVDFVNQWEIGINITTQDKNQIIQVLNQFFQSTKLSEYAANGRAAIAKHFNKQIVQQKVYHFINSTVCAK